ncbi:MAG: 23S rRNA (adenine(2503)-C(2))-methyltransferase RlmN [Deltaproteobacteria bacterium]|nr:MAG: 23S rRNA (adenine(2503)-C(2))-methyltransferase RlmN [Deltaproteobacteria bacterium]
MKKSDIKNYDRKGLAAWFRSAGEPSYRADQVFKWVYLRQTDRFEAMTDISKSLRQRLAETFTVERLHVAAIDTSADGSQKFLFRLTDGQFVESVLMPGDDRYTLCVSSQVGCAMGCRFCMTAQGGLTRSLSPGEIIAQVRDVQMRIPEGGRLTNVVFMGMGEPLANFDAVMQALEVICDGDFGLKISRRRVTLSTCGLVSRFADMAARSRVNLAISLNASDNRTRSMLMPVNHRFPLDTLIDACRAYALTPRDKITFEYILMKGINDSAEDAYRLSRLLRPVQAKINLIPFNEHPKSEFKRPDPSVIQAFQQILLDQSYTVIVRKSMGQDIAAACGQLRANQLESEAVADF